MKGEPLLSDRGDLDGAKRLFDEAAGTNGRCARADFDLGAYHQYLAVARHQPWQIVAARRYYQHAVEEAPKDPRWKQALDALGN